MTVLEIQQEIQRLKKEKNVCILAHAYQRHDIWDVADYVGDSFGLSQRAAEADAETVIMCGVRFMAETVKLLSPQKRVYLANGLAGCPMADQMDRELVSQLKEELPGYTLAAYINTTAELKTICDVCVTSSSAVKILRRLDNDKILFVPDGNLGHWVSQQIPEKTFHLVHGGCPTHLRISKRDVENARKNYPEAKLLIHPECHPAVTAQADFVGSTTEIMHRAIEGSEQSFLIGTENSIVEHLKFACPEKKFIPLSKECVCHNMFSTTLMDVYQTLLGTGGDEICLTDEQIVASRRCIDEMLRLGS